jgi:hypothetical protein
VVLRRQEKKVLIATLKKARSAAQQVKDKWDVRSMDIGGSEALRAHLADEEIL